MERMIEFLQGDCRAVLPTLEAQSVQCCVTSPPYWGLRDYGTGVWEGGNTECEHVSVQRDWNPLDKQSSNRGSSRNQISANCRLCGAVRIDSQLGLEPTPEEYVANMVSVFREVWRVLKDDGTLWLNLGDSYARGCGKGEKFRNGKDHRWSGQNPNGMTGPDVPSGLKPKDLVGIPWRMAFALQSAGWYLRSDIIWAKPNPMPESVTDRPTKSHEYIFLLSKSERYFYDAEAIKEKGNGFNGSSFTSGWDRSTQGFLVGEKPRVETEFRNKRSVWTIATQPYIEAHFATFPEELPKLCILAGSKAGDTILDPFGGSGTTGKVATEMGRKAVLIELNPAYDRLARSRTDVTPGFVF